MRWVRCAACVIALSCVAATCCGAAGEKTAGPSTSPSTPLRLAQGRSGSAQDDKSVGGRRAAKKAVALTPWEQAERGREALEAIPEQTRTRADYARAMDAYRAIYHADPADVHAPAAVNAVAELLAEQGRTLHDEKSLRAAVGQYEFLRTQYPASSLGVQALLAEGQIAQNDLKDAAAARERYKLLLKEHAKSEQAEEARAGLASLEVKGSRFEVQGKTAGVKASAEQPAHPTQPAKLEGSANRGSSATNGVSGGVQPHGLKPSSTVTSDGITSTSLRTGSKAVPLTKQSGHGVQVSSLPAMAQTSSARTAKSAATVVQPTLRDSAAEDGAPSASAGQPDSMAGDVAQSGTPALVTGIRHWSTATYTRVAIDLGDNVTYEAARVPNPDRIYFDLHGTRLAPELVGKSFAVTDDGFLKKVRAAQYSDDVTRVVLDVNDVTEYSAFLLPNPYRLIIDIHGEKEQGAENDETPVATEAPAPRAAVSVKPTAARPVPNSVATKSASQRGCGPERFAGQSGGDEEANLEADLGCGGDGDRFEGSRFKVRGTIRQETNAADVIPTAVGADSFGEFRQEDAEEQGEGGGALRQLPWRMRRRRGQRCRRPMARPRWCARWG